MKKIIKKTISTLRRQGIRATSFLIFRKIKLLFSQKKSKKLLFDDQNLQLQRKTVFEKHVIISVLTPLYNTPAEFLQEMIDSVVEQTYSGWELCLCDASDSEHDYVKEICEAYTRDDRRIIYKKLERNNGISENTNECIKLATGSYFALLDHDDVLHPSALFEAVKAINEKKADFIYTDEAKFKRNIKDYFDPAYKPDFAKDDLRAHNYICHLTVFSRFLLGKVGLYNKAMDGSQDHDMVLRLTEQARCIVHIPKILYFWRSHSGSVSTGINVKPYATLAAIRSVGDQLERQGEQGTVETIPPYPSLYKVNYMLSGNPKISVVIYGDSTVSEFKSCIAAIENMTTFFPVELVIMRSLNSDSIMTIAASLPTVKPFHIFYHDEQKELSAVLNDSVEHSSGDYILFLHTATVLQSGDWATELLMYAQRKDVGAVGIKILDKNNKVYSAGVALTENNRSYLHHMHRGVPAGDQGYEAALMHARNVTSISGKGFMASKEKILSAGGFHEGMGSYVFADMCLRFRQNNLLNVWVPFISAVFYGKDSVSTAKSSIFYDIWRGEIERKDPYYNLNVEKEKIF